MVTDVLNLLLSLFGLAYFIMTVPFVIRRWKGLPKYFSIGALALPLAIVVLFLPRLFLFYYPARYPIGLVIALLLFLFGMGTFVFYLSFGIPDYTSKPVLTENGEVRLLTKDGKLLPLVDPTRDDAVIIRLAQSEDLTGAGRVFAEAFGYLFDFAYGPDREKTSRLLGDLLRFRLNEVIIAVEGNEVIGALWLDLDNPANPKIHPRHIYSVVKRYMDRWNALYFAYIGVPSMFRKLASEDSAYIRWIGVLPQWQGHHVANRLMAKAEELARQSGKKRINLNTSRNNKQAHQLYEHLGFIKRPSSTNIYYVKELK